MQAAVETGVDIPGQISLIDFDDVSFASLPKIQLTTISQPKEEICEVAVRTLEELIAADEPAPISCKTIEPVLVRRYRGLCFLHISDWRYVQHRF